LAVYAVGDIQGCFEPLQKLLEKVAFNPEVDQLWCVGDLVNRGPSSLAAIRYLKSLGDSCICVLGNHDIHLLSQAGKGKLHPSDTIAEILKADDCDDLLDWLRFRPMLHHDPKLNWCMVHAGLHPLWSLAKAKKRARKVEKQLRSDHWIQFCNALIKNATPRHDPLKKGLMRKIFTVGVMTRTRYCTQTGRFDWRSKNNQAVSEEYKDWFKHDNLAWSKDTRVLFGHWAAKGLVVNDENVLGLDSGCVWGGALTLARLDMKKVTLISEPCWACQKVS